MSVTNKLSKFNKLISILLGGIILCLFTCIFESSGFDSFFNSISVGLIFTLLIFSFYGNRAKIKFELIPIGAVLFAISYFSFGPIFDNSNVFLIYSSLFGFSFLCLYSIYIGMTFSIKEYKLYHYIIILFVFFLAVFVSKVTFSHFLLRIISPETASNFKTGLEEKEINLFWREAYLNNFSDFDFAESISGGLEYYNLINVISYVFSVLILFLVVLMFFRDKVAALISLGINAFSAIIFSSFNYIFAYHLKFDDTIQKMIIYFTFGMSLMFIIALVPNKYSAGRKYRSEPYIQNRFLRLIVNFALFELVFVIAPVRTLIYNLAQNAKEYNILIFLTDYKVLIIAGISLIIGLIIFNIFKKNIYDKNLPVPFKIKPVDFSRKAVSIFTFYYSMTYLLTGNAPLVRLAYRVIKNPSVFPKILTDDRFILLPVVVLLFLLIFIIYTPVKRRLSSHH
jgi:hypothetical protein